MSSHPPLPLPGDVHQLALASSERLLVECLLLHLVPVSGQLPPSMVTGRTDSIHLDTDSVLEARRR